MKVLFLLKLSIILSKQYFLMVLKKKIIIIEKHFVKTYDLYYLVIIMLYASIVLEFLFFHNK